MPRYINDIIVHSTATPPGMEVDVAMVTRWHKARKPPFKTIGYHYLVKLDGTIERGRAISQPGAHCKRHNAHSIGVAYVGGVDEDLKPKDTRTDAQKASLLKLLTNLTRMYHCRIHGHRNYAATDCPSFDAAEEYRGIYDQIVKSPA